MLVFTTYYPPKVRVCRDLQFMKALWDMLPTFLSNNIIIIVHNIDSEFQWNIKESPPPNGSHSSEVK